MSRWLSNVGQFLERLDNQAKDVVEERLTSLTDVEKTSNNDVSGENINNILAARGLLLSTDDYDDEQKQQRQQTENESITFTSPEQEGEISTFATDKTHEQNSSEKQLPVVDTNLEQLTIESDNGDNLDYLDSNEGWDDIPSPNVSTSYDDDVDIKVVAASEIFTATVPPVVEEAEVETEMQDIILTESINESDMLEPSTVEENVDENNGTDDLMSPGRDEDSLTKIRAPAITPFHTPAQFHQQQDIMFTPPENDRKDMIPISVMNSKLREYEKIQNENQKEIRKLMRNIVSLNTHLEGTESEMLAQRKELENAAQQMEKDRIRTKSALENLISKHTSEVHTSKVQHEQFIKDLQASHDDQMRAVQEQFKSLEKRRMQEGGDYSKELSESIQREQDLRLEYDMMIDEKDTLLQQILTLQSQQEALGLRLESLTNNADMAMEREHEAERRLDDALETHAKQISQRQAREAELERTVAELGAALVAVRNNNNNTSVEAKMSTTTGMLASSAFHSTSESELHHSLESENEALQSQLAHEQARVATLEKELQEITKERTEETIIVTRTRQQNDRIVADLNQQILQLKAGLRDTKSDPLSEDRSNARESEEIKQIKNLSDEVLRQREKLSTYSSEISTLRTRLNVALNRATVAEAVSEQQSTATFSDLEGGMTTPNFVASGNSSSGRTKRRGRRERDTTDLPSMRKALMLENDHTQTSVKIGQFLDTIDSVLVKVGRILHQNPFARLFFCKSL
jgi:hypothetical protein